MPDLASLRPYRRSGQLHSSVSGVDRYVRQRARTRLDHLLQAPVGINLHRVEVVKPVDFRRVFAELLRERVGQVVRRVGGLSMGGQ